MTAGPITKSAFLVLASGLLLGACGGDEEKVLILEGERKSIVELEDQLRVDPELQDVSVRLPRPYRNDAWPQAGGYSHHAMHHLELSASPRVIWRSDVEGSTSNRKLLAQPVVADGMVFAMGSAWQIVAFDAGTGRMVWRVNMRDGEEKRDSHAGGGIAYHGGRL